MKHDFGPNGPSSKGRGHPVLFDFRAVDDFADGGGYPQRFIQKAYKTLGVRDPSKVLHLCSGSVRVGIRVDVRIEMQPTVVADVRNLPFADESFDWIMADPPYSEDYAANLYGTKDVYPTPFQIVKEACRVLRVGGRVGVLHFQVPMNQKPMQLVSVHGITTGCGYAIRAWSVFEKATAMRSERAMFFSPRAKRCHASD